MKALFLDQVHKNGPEGSNFQVLQFANENCNKGKGCRKNWSENTGIAKKDSSDHAKIFCGFDIVYIEWQLLKDPGEPLRQGSLKHVIRAQTCL